ncbi:hypothetical protein G6F65_019012 [Rhizopus arrhizus]|nr:hypothetical protein G6F65_019012 [Rhizopus arrhizus]
MGHFQDVVTLRRRFFSAPYPADTIAEIKALYDPAAMIEIEAIAAVGWELRLANRLAVAPMTRVSATADGHATPLMADYYEAFAAGGFGLVITEGIYTDKAYAQGYLFQPGLADDAQRDAWRTVVDRVHAHGGRIIAQLMHAGPLGGVAGGPANGLLSG